MATVRGYLFTIVRNLFLKQRRHERREVPLDEQLADGRPGPDERAAGQRDTRIVLAALARLPEIDRAAVLMRADEGVPYEEIAAALGISTVAAKVKVHRARLKLAESLRPAAATAPGKERETMNITRDVVKDLVAVYLAGEASADTRALVEDWLRSDPELAAQVERARGLELPAVALLRRRSRSGRSTARGGDCAAAAIVLGAAIYFSTLPLTVTFGSDGFHGLLLKDWSARIPALVVAAVLWVVYWRMSRRLGARGL